MSPPSEKQETNILFEKVKQNSWSNYGSNYGKV